MPGTDDRARALDLIATLARQHALSPAEIAAAIGDIPSRPEEPRARAVLVRVLGCLGGTFVFAGLGVFIASQWSGMNSGARVVVTLGSGIAAFALGLIASRDTRFAQATTPLFLIAAGLEPTGMLVAFQEFGSGGDPVAWIRRSSSNSRIRPTTLMAPQMVDRILANRTGISR